MYKLGNAKNMSMEKVKQQADKAGYSQLSPMEGMKAAFIKKRNVVIIYDDGMVEGVVL